ncbi:hypothetical protein AALO_G00273450 [Alosa alosa]|uniref:Uncharacterized protein n=1 Tax=Alosa alosa TaxID=278164 RepID=A0AAV6FMF9_9TELE|nr:uncharacterized protein LOC125287782 [Alosa alosa]KAG5262282.1 hypothetical protein AALO_G00273450 [Alosa alosa]
MWAEMAHNQLVSSSTGMSPFKVQNGFQPPLFPDQQRAVAVPSAEAAVAQCRRTLRRARQTLLKMSARHQKQANRRRQRGPSFKVGQKSKKFTPRWTCIHSAKAAGLPPGWTWLAISGGLEGLWTRGALLGSLSRHIMDPGLIRDFHTAHPDRPEPAGAGRQRGGTVRPHTVPHSHHQVETLFARTCYLAFSATCELMSGFTWWSHD